MDAKSRACLNPDGHSFQRGAVVFTNGGGVADWFIRMAQGFRGYTHCGIALGNGKMVASFAPSGGVCLQDDMQQIVTEARMLPGGAAAVCYHSLALGMLSLALPMLGKPYDWGALLGFVGGPTFGSGPPDRFTCSSFIAYVGLKSGWSFPKPGSTRLVLPQDLWNELNV